MGEVISEKQKPTSLVTDEWVSTVVAEITIMLVLVAALLYMWRKK
jgi:hypothetical protein